MLQMRAAEERHQATLASRPFAHLGHNNREIVDMEGKNGITIASRAKKRVPSHHKENGNNILLDSLILCGEMKCEGWIFPCLYVLM
jgi:hypothetical protein